MATNDVVNGCEPSAVTVFRVLHRAPWAYSEWEEFAVDPIPSEELGHSRSLPSEDTTAVTAVVLYVQLHGLPAFDYRICQFPPIRDIEADCPIGPMSVPFKFSDCLRWRIAVPDANVAV